MTEKKKPTAPPRKRKKRTKNMYFTKVHENAIIEYAKSDCNKVKSNLYIKLIGPAFSEMVDKIVYTYKFTNLPNIDYLKDDCKIWLTTILNKYDPNRKSKAFSYFSVITKNWFIHKVKKNSKSLKREVCFEDLSSGPSKKVHETLIVENQYDEMRQQAEFLFYLKNEIHKWENLNLKENERRVLNAIKILFESVDDIEIFNKKAIYLYIREITGLNTKQVVNNLNKMRTRYREFKTKWDEGNI
jgi:hypothetical protein